ncbi:MAG: ATP-binding protein [Bacteroidia bacterium]|nr:ATP-binding protein [Bacteroidia bacterium]
MDSPDSLKRILQRERAARKAAEEIMEAKSLELYQKHQELIQLNESLEEKICERTAEIEAFSRELVRAKDKAEAADRAKSDFLSNMSHEIRTPLNAIVGLTELILRDSADPQAREFARSIKFSADNLLVIINEVLDFSKIEAGKLTFESVPFRLSEVLESLMQTYRVKAEEKSLELRALIHPDTPDFLQGDPVKLGQVLINLLGNAIKFTHQGFVRLHVQARAREADRCRLRICVEDSGIGIPQDRLDAIFESFSQASTSTARMYGGTGLGLTITRRIIELQGGAMEVESRIGEGSRFTFELPCLLAAPESLPLAAPKQEPGQLGHLRVLLVEDIPMNQMLMRQVLRRKQIQADIASNGLEALDFLAANDYDVVLMDLHMPVMDGREATRIIRDPGSPVRRHDVPIIALTADAFQDTRSEVEALGMNDFLTKPLNMDELYAKLHLLAEGLQT